MYASYKSLDNKQNKTFIANMKYILKTILFKLVAYIEIITNNKGDTNLNWKSIYAICLKFKLS